MIQATLKEVADWCEAISLTLPDTGAGDARIRGVSIDTRSIKQGQLFVPLAGERSDGHTHLQAAEEAGAAAALWQQDHPLPAAKIPLIVVADTLTALHNLAAGWLSVWHPRIVGVTGSNGKTTTKDLIASVLSQSYAVVKTEGNFNNHIGLPLTILGADTQAQILILEMGMSGRGEIALLAEIAKPETAVITNVGESHLLQLGTRRNIAQAKLEIAAGLKPGGTLIYYGDEPLLQEELAALKLPDGHIRTVTFGERPENALRAAEITGTADGVSFVLAGESAEVTYTLPIPGRHNAINALAAIAVGRLYQVPDDRIAQGLSEAKLTGMRIERVQAWNGAVILNDAYNASPTSVKAAIALVSQLTGFRRKWLVLGDMRELGPDEAAFHAGIGKELGPEQADGLFAYGPLSAHTAREAQLRLPNGAVAHFTDKPLLLTALLAQVEPEDLVLVKASRGMRLEEIVRGLQQGKEG